MRKPSRLLSVSSDTSSEVSRQPEPIDRSYSTKSRDKERDKEKEKVQLVAFPIDVAIRLRPPFNDDEGGVVETCFWKRPPVDSTGAPENRTLVHLKAGTRMTEEISFSHVAGPEESNAALYQSLQGSSISQRVFEGYQETVFAYGQTGSGKTHTMFGTDQERGLMHFFLSDVMNLLPDSDAQREPDGGTETGRRATRTGASSVSFSCAAGNSSEKQSPTEPLSPDPHSHPSLPHTEPSNSHAKSASSKFQFPHRSHTGTGTGTGGESTSFSVSQSSPLRNRRTSLIAAPAVVSPCASAVSRTSLSSAAPGPSAKNSALHRSSPSRSSAPLLTLSQSPLAGEIHEGHGMSKPRVEIWLSCIEVKDNGIRDLIPTPSSPSPTKSRQRLDRSLKAQDEKEKGHTGDGSSTGGPSRPFSASVHAKSAHFAPLPSDTGQSKSRASSSVPCPAGQADKRKATSEGPPKARDKGDAAGKESASSSSSSSSVWEREERFNVKAAVCHCRWVRVWSAAAALSLLESAVISREGGTLGVLTLVDLAGSEMHASEGAGGGSAGAGAGPAGGGASALGTDVSKRQTKYINTSLSHLNRMVKRMQKGRREVSDRRQSALNTVLFDAFDEFCGVTMIFCLQPARSCYSQSKSTLQMALECSAIRRERKKVNREENNQCVFADEEEINNFVERARPAERSGARHSSLPAAVGPGFSLLPSPSSFEMFSLTKEGGASFGEKGELQECMGVVKGFVESGGTVEALRRFLEKREGEGEEEVARLQREKELEEERERLQREKEKEREMEKEEQKRREELEEEKRR
eukprot:Cvel_8302.t3-p1 / transcript=Cvel_8302.t3 / gene=Cvel_8302 / organism=Chromera_velia_CCMP2878 / gene_product=hypothetical protein / transcript_product=hypothetical protein / location=Cvel_scaffold456:9264-14008(+) / protein_length=805 / sequence_SO=supercontig / SO=protein_coding / is_pseudo=false